jgi:hypothetical protein
MGSFDTPEVCARALRAVATKRLTARPWNRFDLDDLWWLIPSKDWPAYRHGKLTATRRYAAPGELFLGINLEKGFGQTAASAYPEIARTGQLLRPDWAWHEVISERGADEFQSALVDLPRDLQPQLVLHAVLVQDPRDYDPHDEVHKMPKDQILFDLVDGRPRVRESQLEAHLLESLTRTLPFTEVVASVSTLPGRDWIWIDLYAGIRISRNSAAEIGDIYRNSLSKFERWLI